MINNLKDKLFAIFAGIVLLFVVGWISYCEMNTYNMTVEVQLKKGVDPFTTLKQIMPANSSLISVQEMNHDRNEYRLTVKTRQTRKHFLDWLSTSNRVEKIVDCSK